jgi:phenylacetate-CoA ligase
VNWRGALYRGWRGLRRDRQFELLRGLRAAETWPAARIAEAQADRLRALLLHAFAHVDYYREILADAGVVRAGTPPIVDLSRFHTVPLLDRATVRGRATELQDRRPPARGNARLSILTGGTTGDPLRVSWDRATYQHAMAVKLWFDEWTGYVPGQPKVLLWAGRARRPGLAQTLARRASWLLRNETLLPSNFLSPAILDGYIERLNRIRPIQILAYSRPLYELARRAETTGRTVASPRAVIVSAESLLGEHRATIERVFRAPVHDRYGSDELGDVACQCVARRGLHVSALTHHVEVLRTDGHPAGPGEVGEIVVTPLTNYAMPLVRYRIGDLGTLDAAAGACPCGRALPALGEIVGRLTDSFVRPDGTLVHGLYVHNIYRRIPRTSQWLERFQVIQSAVDRVHVRLVDRDCLPDPLQTRRADLEAIAAYLRAGLGEQCHVTFDFLGEIPCAPSGKHRTTISLVPR